MALMLLTGCEGGAVVFAPTPLPPDVSALNYTHPAETFSISVPRAWSVYVQNTPTLTSATFSPPGSPDPLLTAAVINLGQPVDAAGFGDLMEAYQTLYRPDVRHYTEQSREAMGDGGWRLTGYRITPGGAPQAINTFFAFSGSLIGVVEVVLPRDGARQADLQTAVNSFRINPTGAVGTGGALQVSDLEALSGVRSGTLEVQNVFAWTNAFGVFFVMGEVANTSNQAVASVPVRVALTGSDGSTVIEAVDVAMGYGIAPGGFAPFSLRFGEGQPDAASNYRITLGDAEWAAQNPPQAPGFVGLGTLAWTDESRFADDGALLISGTVTNQGETPARDSLGIVTVFDGQQQVIGAWFAPLNAPLLPPGEPVAFEIRVPEIGGEPINYILDIQALVE
jgi:hypothetical protein